MMSELFATTLLAVSFAFTAPDASVWTSGGLNVANQALPPAAPASGAMLYGQAGQLAQVQDSGLQQNLSTAQADTLGHTVLAASLTNLSSVYTIPANDPSVGSTYRLTCGGFGQQASVPRTLQFGFFLNGTGVGISPTLTNTSTAASDLFRWTVTAYVVCASTGSGGTWWGQMRGDVTDATIGNVGGGGAGISVGAGCVTFSDANQTAFAASTLVGLPFVIKAAWGNVTNSPTISCTHTIFEKVC